MPIGKGLVVIGMGERSSHQAITQVARNLFAAGAAERVDHRQPAEDPRPPCTWTPCSPSATATW